jgi:hypothetical protein
MVENGNEPVVWTVSALPEGLDFDAGGERVHGFPLVMGEFQLAVQATDAIGLTDSVAIDLTVGPPLADLQTMAEPFLGVGTADVALANFLDYQGNRTGDYDLGDFRAWVLDNPDHPAATFVASPAPTVIRLFRKKRPAR